MAVGKYDTHVKPKLLLIEAWARDGLTDEMICKNLGISVASFHNYKNAHLEFLEALKRGKDDIDVMVENALLKAALGYTFEEVTYEPTGIVDGDGQNRLTESKRVVKEVTPNTTALIFWLKNRRPAAWRDKHEIESKSEVVNRHEYHIEQTINSDPETAELLKQLYKRSLVASVGDSS